MGGKVNKDEKLLALALLLSLQKKVKSHLDICCPWSPEELVPFKGRRSQGIFYASVEKTYYNIDIFRRIRLHTPQVFCVIDVEVAQLIK